MYLLTGLKTALCDYLHSFTCSGILGELFRVYFTLKLLKLFFSLMFISVLKEHISQYQWMYCSVPLQVVCLYHSLLQFTPPSNEFVIKNIDNWHEVNTRIWSDDWNNEPEFVLVTKKRKTYHSNICDTKIGVKTVNHWLTIHL